MVASAPAGFDRLVFVHVGKCAGTSVALGLRKFGARYEELHCLGATPRDPATHAHRMVERLSATRGSYFLIVVRDPVQRLISAFNYDLFFKRIQADRRGPDGRWAEIYDRFPTIDDLGLALGDTGSEQQWWARRALTASGLHLQFGLSWYIPPEIAHRFTPENSFVIRTEAAQSDFDRFCAQVLDPAADGVPLLTRELSDYRDQLPDGAQELSQAAKHGLMTWSRPEYDVLDTFYRQGLIASPYQPGMPYDPGPDPELTVSRVRRPPHGAAPGQHSRRSLRRVLRRTRRKAL